MPDPEIFSKKPFPSECGAGGWWSGSGRSDSPGPSLEKSAVPGIVVTSGEVSHQS